jgi:hypothetical protein
MSEPAKRTEVAHVQTAEIVTVGAAPLMDVISRAAADPNTDVDKLERLLGMYERITARDAEQAFNEAMRAAQAEMPLVLRDAKNDQTNSRYARLETVSRAMDPIITHHGFALSFGTDASPIQGHYRVTCRLSHTAGHSRDYHADVPADLTGMKGNQNKTATHAFGSTMSYGRRYLKLLIFDIAMTDDDGQAAGGGFVTEAQARQIETLLTEANADRAAFLKYMGVDELAHIRASEFQKALASLAAKKRARAAASR